MDISDKILTILSLEAIRPSTKNSLIALAVKEQPLTTSDLNAILNLNKTFHNYEEIFEEQIEEGSVKIVKQRSNGGYTRKHFILDIEKLLEQSEE